ncbi:MAG: DUF5668 domain-containing protein [candidate division Zixibacteria bacterium]
MGRKNRKEKRRPIISGLIFLCLGIYLMLGMHTNLDLEDSWPVFIILAGAALIIGAMRRKEKVQPDTPSSTTHQS